MTSLNDLTSQQKLAATLHRDVYNICNETCHRLGLTITQGASEIVAELLLKKLAIFSTDLEAFAKHAKRQTINSDDVKLLVRRNPHLLELITRLAGETASKEKRRKTLPASRAEPTPAPLAPPVPLAPSIASLVQRHSERQVVLDDAEMEEFALVGDTILKENTPVNILPPKDKNPDVSAWKSKQKESPVASRLPEEAVVLNKSAMDINDTIDLTFD